LTNYAEKLNQFVIDNGFDKYVGNVVENRIRSVLDYDFEHEVWQAGSRVYFNRDLKGGNLENLHDSVNRLMDNKRKFDMLSGTHIVDEVMRDKLADVAKDVSELSCDSILKNEERATVICGVAMEQFYRDRVGKFAGTRVIQSFVDNDKIKEPGKSKFYGDLQDYLSYQMREKLDENFGFYDLTRAKSIDLGLVKNNNDTIYASCADAKHLVDLVSAFNVFDSDVKDFSDNLDIKAKSETKRKTLNVPFEVQSDKILTDNDDDDFDK
jgi:hypothetical protein